MLVALAVFAAFCTLATLIFAMTELQMESVPMFVFGVLAASVCFFLWMSVAHLDDLQRQVDTLTPDTVAVTDTLEG